jgi:PAS domain S-box-containing protein
MPTLDKLMESDRAAWLWDGDLSRIVWANRAGIAFFGGETLFDLVDLPFDPKSAALSRIAELTRSLARGAEAVEELTFVGAGGLATVRCRCQPHALADGREGLLVVALGGAEAAEARPGLFSGVLAALPMAAAVSDGEGTVVIANDAARALAGERGALRLADILGEEALARDLLAAAGEARAASRLSTLATSLGRRDVRITLRRVDLAGEEAEPFFLMLVEDVTERKKLERRLAGAAPSVAAEGGPGPARPLSAAEAEAFARLGRDLARANGLPLLPEKAAPAPPAKSRPHVPEIIERTVDASPQPCLVYRAGEALVANTALVKLLGHVRREEALDRGDLLALLGAAADGAVIDLAPVAGPPLKVRVRQATFPWNTGRVSMAVLTPISEAEAKAIAPEAAAEPARAVAEAETAKVSPPAEPAAETVAPPAPPVPEPADGFAMPADELRHILDTASDGIITLDASGHVLGLSAGAAAIFGYDEAEVSGKPFIDLLTTASRRTVRDYLAAFEDGGMASVFNDGREVEAVVKQGGSVPLFITIGQLPPARAEAAGEAAPRRTRPAFCVVARDITQWKKTESELRSAKEEAERASRQKSEFLANISHELRTPLNAILGFSDVMRTERFGEMRNERYRGYAHDIHTSGEHLLSLINDLLDLSKVEAGKLELNFTSVNLANLVDEVIAILQEQAAAARIVLRKSVATGIPNVVADLRSMKQILLNLVSNALKFTDPGGQIVISLRMHKSGELTLSVKDTGIGMSETELKRALEPFQRIGRAGREERPGTGLGLPLTRALAEANRARFAISSEPRRGTLVEITFPVPRVLA